MDDVAREGRTVLFVSHNMAAVENLCQRGIVLHRGKVQFVGNKTQAITYYLTSFSSNMISLLDRKDREGSGEIRVVKIEVLDMGGNILDIIASGQDIDIYLHFEVNPGFSSREVIASIRLKTQFDVPVFLHHNRMTRDEFGELPKTGAFVCHIKRLPVPPCNYRIAYSIMSGGEYLDRISDAAELTVVEGDFFGSGEVPPASQGICLVDAKWRLEIDKTSTLFSE
jgi:lipopolysaccharide transport system ATP-binding protein